MNSERTRIVVHRSRNAASKKHNLRSKLLLFSSPIVSLSPIKEEPGPGNTMGILSASCHGAFATVVEANSAMNPYSMNKSIFRMESKNSLQKKREKVKCGIKSSTKSEIKCEIR